MGLHLSYSKPPIIQGQAHKSGKDESHVLSRSSCVNVWPMARGRERNRKFKDPVRQLISDRLDELRPDGKGMSLKEASRQMAAYGCKVSETWLSQFMSGKGRNELDTNDAMRRALAGALRLDENRLRSRKFDRFEISPSDVNVLPDGPQSAPPLTGRQMEQNQLLAASIDFLERLGMKPEDIVQEVLRRMQANKEPPDFPTVRRKR